MKFRKIAAIVLSAVLAATCLTSCGDKAGNSSTESGSADGNKTLVIGASGPLTGDAASYGVSAKNGAQIAVDEINAAGGVNGVKFDFKMLDDATDPITATNNYATLMDQGMQVSLGCVTSGACSAFADEAVKNNTLIVTPSASSADCTKNPNAFRVCFSDPNQGTYAADFIADNHIGSKIAIIYDSSDNYSTGLHDNFVKEAGAKKLAVVSDTAFTKDTNTDFSSQISAAKAGGADLVFLPIYYTQAAAILTQAKGNLDASVKFLGCDGLDGLLGIVEDTKLVENVILLTAFFADSKNDVVKKFVESYKKKFNATPDQFAADGYDAIYTIKSAMEKTGISDTDVSDLNDQLIAAMTKITVNGATGTITWTADGEPSKDAAAVVIKSGKYENYKA